MDVKTYAIPDLVLVTPKVFGDERGFFMETYNRKAFTEAGIPHEFVQDNHSRSIAGTLRGLHFQVVREQAKLVRCLQGSIFDVAVDIRPGSPTFGLWVGEVLSDENKAQLFVPAGFAHGFQVLSATAEVAYKCTDLYSPKDERGIIYNDSDLKIQWPGSLPPLLSDKDRLNRSLAEIDLSEIRKYGA